MFCLSIHVHGYSDYFHFWLLRKMLLWTLVCTYFVRVPAFNSFCVYVCVYVYICICVYICIGVYLYVYISMYVYISVWVYIYTHTHMWIAGLGVLFLRNWRIFWGTEFLLCFLKKWRWNSHNIKFAIFKVYNSVAFSTFTMLCSHYLYLVPFSLPAEGDPTRMNQALPIPPSLQLLATTSGLGVLLPW